MTVAWPAFIAACVLEFVVFAFVDPMEMHGAGATPGWSRQAIYTASFFVFWAVVVAACASTMLLGRNAPEP
jgi:hypothetical protein